MSLVTTDPRVRGLLQAATAWRLLGLLLERPREGWREEVGALSLEVSDPEIKAAADAARDEATEGLYLALLGPGGVVSPREVPYRRMADPGHILADITAFYRAFAFEPDTEEAPDHLAVEAAFLGYLCLKEAFALARGSTEAAQIVAQAASRFRADHLSALAWSFAERLETADVRYLSLTATALARRSGAPPSSEPSAAVPLPRRDDCSMECGRVGHREGG